MPPSAPASSPFAAWRAQAAADALPPTLAARLDAAPAAAPDAETELATTLDLLQQLAADREVLAAAILHARPELQDTIPALVADMPALPALLEGQRAAGRVWDLHAEHAESGAEGLRRLLMAIVRDLRVLPILLARQLARMRAAAALPEEARTALARLTADIHAPLANRLGIWQLKWELEDLAFRYLQPETYRNIARLLDEKRAARETWIEDVKQRLREALAEQGVRADVAGRPKHIFSIWKKMQKKNRPFGELYDIRAVRVLVDDLGACYTALGVVHATWVPIPSEFDDYIAKPKGNDYRSLHTAVVGPEGKTLEVQIRTHEMHAQAELGVAAHWRYKEGGGRGSRAAEFERKVAWMRRLLDPSDQEATATGDDGALLAGLSTELVEDRTYLLTPKGEVIDLPRGGTVLDFAYHVHTEVGHRCIGAKVNGRIVPLDFAPASGDRVEIMTGKVSSPRRDWLVAANGYLVSARSRDKVRAWFHKLDRARNVAAGRDLLDRELRRLALLGADLAPVLPRFHADSVDDLLVLVALGDVGPSQIGRALHEHAQEQAAAAKGEAARAETGLPERRVRPPRPSDRFTVEGVGNLLTQLARCCQPVAGDPIVGYLTRGRGVSIHRENCPALLRLAARHPERVLPVDWGLRGMSSYSADVLVRAVDRKWLLKDLSNLIAQEGAHVLGVNTRVDDGRGRAELRFTLKVSDYDQLGRLLGKLASVPGVTEARRSVETR
ncbi:RelA/SpoT family protein [Coralloluteibacterium stylophorae]|uniref:GTP pyrophosphokinase n=1 Tax=Coralloluteibacterium stylophorae TaxID=1776034 RepID=A0A8J7VSW8_9GAMM|nr:bifunctional (p)ppGpp synthetase/guanosine-3',5'-bis(diphosphate) 3'-pyrophosphohydrolase [Coralloluteibacterium stylophorae]MBS7456758.1 bifunctional (p)ppGpp synthetase/guanosine-3',5'-bis(diphosphate) 3'-pyrophosphohydrolase [Coralloluteibacterium stylophorae]